MFQAKKKITCQIFAPPTLYHRCPQLLVVGLVLLKNAVFQDLDPLLWIKKCDERAKPPKTESPNTYPSKILYTSSQLYF